VLFWHQIEVVKNIYEIPRVEDVMRGFEEKKRNLWQFWFRARKFIQNKNKSNLTKTTKSA
jgi:hypothetical protein